MTCTFPINANLPLLTFYFPGRPDNTFGNVEITAGTSNEVIQTIENTTEAGSLAPANAQSMFTAVDAHFDGYQNLKLLINCGGKGNCSYIFISMIRR
jgi:hypothetical protein